MKNEKNRILMILIILCAGGCDVTSQNNTAIEIEQKDYQKIIQKIENKNYTLKKYKSPMFGGEKLVVEEMYQLVKIKDAYWWLISSLDSKDVHVKNTANRIFVTTNNPGSISSQSLFLWYKRKLQKEWRWNGSIWEPGVR